MKRENLEDHQSQEILFFQTPFISWENFYFEKHIVCIDSLEQESLNFFCKCLDGTNFRVCGPPVVSLIHTVFFLTSF